MRPDIPNALRVVARHSHNPTDRQLKAVMKITAYLHGTRDSGLTFVRGSGLELTAYSDANYADESSDRRSVSETAVTLGGAAVSWVSCTQNVSSCPQNRQSTSPSEGVNETLFTGAVLSVICFELSGSCVRVFEDNQGGIALAENPLSSSRSKHFDVQFHSFRELFCKKDRISL